MRTASQVVSVILHPLVMPTFGLLCYYALFPIIAQFSDPQLFLGIFIRVLLFTLLIPFMSVLVMMRMGKVSTMFIEEKRERSWPLLLAAGIYLFTYYFILNSPRVPAFVSIFILGAAGAMLLALLINLKWKISLHMIGIGGMCGALTVIYFLMQEGNPVWLSVWFILAGVLGTARLILDAHTPLQILAGFALGFAVEFSLAFLAVH
jgi:membrane-associated phospholipid phosphatase